MHPDLTWVTPSGAAEMLVADIDEPVVAAATRTPFEARRRVFVIERAETMNDQAANRMLKTLEEPADFAHLVLLTDRPGEILPTDRLALPARALRRAERRRDRRPPARDRRPTTAQACARLGLGDGERARAAGLRRRPEAARERRGLRARRAARRPRRAPVARRSSRAPRPSGTPAQADVEARLAEELDYLPARERKRAEREGAEAAGAPPAARAPARWTRRSQLAGLWFRDVAAVADGAPELVHAVDRLDALSADAEGRGPHALRRAVEHVDEARALLILNPSEELLLEALAYRLERMLRGASRPAS